MRHLLQQFMVRAINSFLQSIAGNKPQSLSAKSSGDKLEINIIIRRE